jgi:hypothetical protein
MSLSRASNAGTDLFALRICPAKLKESHAATIDGVISAAAG